ncbi:unnamed protein product [Heligmosomoides polygyrus]|uniref:50S ribosomal protein L21 n=1 Tax=Heligmosomoides polygyrus TaxID=6339 RepID=A0A183FYM6_HELPZ|nr:unnamed protein product [Heligmosomoides polygyrus]
MFYSRHYAHYPRRRFFGREDDVEDIVEVENIVAQEIGDVSEGDNVILEGNQAVVEAAVAAEYDNPFRSFSWVKLKKAGWIADNY